MEEIWKDIEGYEGYQVSDLGRIRHNGKILKGSTNGRYKTILIGGRKYKRFYFHRLVAMLFCEKPEHLKEFDFSELDVDHIDGNVLNNVYLNLRWCTTKENCNYLLHRESLSKSLKGNMPWNKGKKRFLSEETYNLISEKAKQRLKNKENHPMYNKGRKVVEKDKNGNIINIYMNSVRAAEIKGCSPSLIQNCCNKKPHCNTACGSIWEYA